MHCNVPYHVGNQLHDASGKICTVEMDSIFSERIEICVSATDRSHEYDDDDCGTRHTIKVDSPQRPHEEQLVDVLKDCSRGIETAIQQQRMTLWPNKGLHSLPELPTRSYTNISAHRPSNILVLQPAGDDVTITKMQDLQTKDSDRVKSGVMSRELVSSRNPHQANASWGSVVDLGIRQVLPFTLKDASKFVRVFSGLIRPP